MPVGTKEARSSALGDRAALDTAKLVHAFLTTHASAKLAAKLAARYPDAALDSNAGSAEELSKVLVGTVRSAMDDDQSPLMAALHGTAEERPKKRAKKAKKADRTDADVGAAAADQDALEAAPASHAEAAAVDGWPSADTVVDGAAELASERPSQTATPPHGKKTPPQRFQRVKSDSAQFLDERLRNMSYEAKACVAARIHSQQSGTGDWGAKASADLMVTQGKSFTKEKNKKKRGSYRGGVIDQGSHSVKFTYDDE
ncbi:jun-like transcription factor [Malassezia sp. CBS 17886]|nr:jun-like transcription factor [Malassezia sp. CBS 17886]